MKKKTLHISTSSLWLITINNFVSTHITVFNGNEQYPQLREIDGTNAFTRKMQTMYRFAFFGFNWKSCIKT